MHRFFANLVLILSVGIAVSASGQTPSPTPFDDTDIQSWNDLTVSKELTGKVDAVVQTTYRFTKNVSRLNEGRIGGGFVFKPHARVSIAPLYLFIKARNSAGRFVTENRLSLALSYRFPVKKIGLSHRSQIEYRIRTSGRSWRYRPSVTVEKEVPEKWIEGLKVFVTEDLFYDSAAGRFSRNRLSLGVNKRLSGHVSLDLYYLRQDDRNSITRVSHIIGTGWKVKF